MDVRLIIFNAVTVPTVKRQTAPVVWFIRIGAHTPLRDRQNIKAHLPSFAHLFSLSWAEMVQFYVKWHCRPGDYLLTTRLDNDDGLVPEFSVRLQEAAAGLANSLWPPSGGSCVLDVPEGFCYDLSENKWYHHTKFFINNIPTHFVSLLQRCDDKSLPAGIHTHERHRHLSELYRVVNVPGLLWIECTHPHNLCNKTERYYMPADVDQSQFGLEGVDLRKHLAGVPPLKTSPSDVEYKKRILR